MGEHKIKELKQRAIMGSDHIYQNILVKNTKHFLVKNYYM